MGNADLGVEHKEEERVPCPVQPLLAYGGEKSVTCFVLAEFRDSSDGTFFFFFGEFDIVLYL